MNHALLANVSALAGQMQELARQAHAGYAAEVDAIIAARSGDTRQIERLLDGILDFGFDAARVQLFGPSGFPVGFLIGPRSHKYTPKSG